MFSHSQLIKRLQVEVLEDRTAPATFQPIGSGSYATGVSSDGSVVVGWAHTDFQEIPSFRWTPSGGMEVLPQYPGSRQTNAADVSSLGTVIVGDAHYDFTPPGGGITTSGIPEAVRWTETEGFVALSDRPVGLTFGSYAIAVSGDGSVIVGAFDSGYSSNYLEAFRWTQATGRVGLGDLPGGSEGSTATDISTDGFVIVGFSVSGSDLNYNKEAFRWTAADGMVGLGLMHGDQSSTFATAVSADGAVIVGYSTFAGGTEAFRWTAADGFIGLGELPGGSLGNYPTSVSADGSVIVGNANSASDEEAFIWTEADGMRSLREVLVTDGGLGTELSGWVLETPVVSDDGYTVVGVGGRTGGGGGWVAHLDSPTDIHVISAKVIQSGSAVQFTYETTGNVRPFEVGLYRSSDGVTYDPADRIGDLRQVTPSPTNPQQPGTIALQSPLTYLRAKPFFVVAADPTQSIIEGTEGNNVAALLDVGLTSAQLVAPELVSYRYKVVGDLEQPLQVGMFWSLDDKYDASDRLAGFDVLTGTDVAAGVHDRQLNLTAPPPTRNDSGRPLRHSLLMVLDFDRLLLTPQEVIVANNVLWVSPATGQPRYDPAPGAIRIPITRPTRWPQEARRRLAEMHSFLGSQYAIHMQRDYVPDRKSSHSRWESMDVSPRGRTSWEQLALAAHNAGFWVYAEDVRLAGTEWPRSRDADAPHLHLYNTRPY